MIAAMGVLGSSADAARFVYYNPVTTPAHDGRPMNMELALAVVGTERAELADELAAVGVPTLVMIGLWDRHVGFDMARDLADRLPDAVLRVFQRSGHLIDEEEPDTYIRAIIEFVRAGSG
jgi:proline iminopeptidase